MVLKPEPLFARGRCDRGGARGAGDGDADVAARASGFTQAEARAAERRWRTWCSCAGATKGSTSGSASAGDRGDLDRRLRADRRRTAGAGDRRRGGAAGAGVVGDEQSVADDSFARAGCSTFRSTRGRAEFRGLRGARRAVVGEPRARSSAGGSARRSSRTLERRPDLLDAAALDDEEREMLRELIKEQRHERD